MLACLPSRNYQLPRRACLVLAPLLALLPLLGGGLISTPPKARASLKPPNKMRLCNGQGERECPQRQRPFSYPAKAGIDGTSYQRRPGCYIREPHKRESGFRAITWYRYLFQNIATPTINKRDAPTQQRIW